MEKNSNFKEIVCPAELEQTTNSIFFAGGITDCPNWQYKMAGLLRDVDLVAFNPRRPHFPIGDNKVSRQQIEWEHRYLKIAEAALFWFPCETLCPITLYELGAWSRTTKPLFIGVHPDYKRKIDVEVQTELARPDVKIVHSLKDLAQQIKTWREGK